MSLFVPPFYQPHGLLIFDLIECNGSNLFHGSTIPQVFIPDVVTLVYSESDIKHAHNQPDHLQDRDSCQDYCESPPQISTYFLPVLIHKIFFYDDEGHYLAQVQDHHDD